MIVSLSVPSSRRWEWLRIPKHSRSARSGAEKWQSIPWARLRLVSNEFPSAWPEISQVHPASGRAAGSCRSKVPKGGSGLLLILCSARLSFCCFVFWATFMWHSSASPSATLFYSDFSVSCEGIFCVRDALQELEPASKTRVLYQKKESKESQESIDMQWMIMII